MSAAERKWPMPTRRDLSPEEHKALLDSWGVVCDVDPETGDIGPEERRRIEAALQHRLAHPAEEIEVRVEPGNFKATREVRLTLVVRRK